MNLLLMAFSVNMKNFDCISNKKFDKLRRTEGII